MTETLDRSKYLGSSDVAAILGVSPWRTALDVYLDKVQPRQEQHSNSKQNVLTRGLRLEPYIIDLLAQDHELEIVGRNQRYKDPEYPFMACEVDAEYNDKSLGSVQNIEIKTVHPYKIKEWGEADTDSIPIYYTAQAMHSLMVTGRQVCIFGVLIGADDFRTYRIERDDETIAAIREKEVAFWDRVQSLQPPEATTANDILRLFDRDSGRAIEANSKALDALNNLRDAKAQVKELEANIEQFQEQIKLFLQDATSLTVNGKPVATWKTQDTTRFNQKEFSEQHPELFEAFKQTTKSRVFRLK